MKSTASILIVLLSLMVALPGGGCKKKVAKQDSAFQHTTENTYQKIQEIRLQLVEAMEKKNLQYIHDSMYYFKGLLTALSTGLQGEKKERVDNVLKELTVIAEEIDNSAGRGNQAATEANLQKLIDSMKQLETEFQSAKK